MPTFCVLPPLFRLFLASSTGPFHVASMVRFSLGEHGRTHPAASAAPAATAPRPVLAALAALAASSLAAALAALAALASALAACVGLHRLGRLYSYIGQHSGTHLHHAGDHGLRSAVLQSGRRVELALLDPELRWQWAHLLASRRRCTEHNRLCSGSQ